MGKFLEVFSTPRAYLASVATLLLLTWFGIYAFFSKQVSTVVLTLEMASSTPSNCRLFFDTGRGFQESDSETVSLNSSSLSRFQTLSFEIPHRTDIKQLRFDLLSTAGTFVVRNVTGRSGSGILLQIPPEDIVPFRQIAERVQRGNEVRFSTIPGADDPGLTFSLRRPLKQSRRFDRVLRNPGFWKTFISTFLLSALLALLRDRVFSAANWAVTRAVQINYVFGRVGARLTAPEVLRLDSFAVWFCAVCFALFLIGVSLDLNGSSAGVYPAVYKHGAPAKILLGTPEQSRNDEWDYVTPDILNQVFRADRFQTLNSELGSHSAALTGNIPVWHISTLFRPQYWAFFVLPADYAFAFYWQSKALILVLGVFAWLLVLTHSTFWSATGSLWYFFSPLTQWAYSWPSALPETIGFLLLTTVMACCLTVETRKPALLIEGIGLAIGSIEFALCSYPPHMIPLFWVAAFFLLSWCLAKRDVIFRREHAARRMLAFACAIAVIAAIGLSVFLDLRVAIPAIANTFYPGRRILNGGTTPWFVLPSSLLAWTQKESRVPAALGNICEGSSYLWIAPITLILLGRLKFSNFQKWALRSLWLSFSVLLIWLVLPIPASVGAILGLDRTGGSRVFPALGLANVAIVVLCGAAMSNLRFPIFGTTQGRALSALQKGWLHSALGFAGFAMILFLVRAINREFNQFFSWPEVLLAAVIATGLFYLFLTRRWWAFAALLLVPQAVMFGRVNPFERGLSVFVASDLRKFIRQNPALLRGEWLVFSDSVVNAGFFAATGVEVYGTNRYIPDIDHFSVFAAHHFDLNIVNRDGYLDAHLRRPSEPMRAENPAVPVLQLDVRPGDPILKELGIRYAAFDFLPDDDARMKLRPLSATPIDGYWLYALR